jgi:hypothetical protein
MTKSDDKLKKANERIRQGKRKLEEDARRIKKSNQNDADKEPTGKIVWPKDDLSLIRELDDDKQNTK